MEFRNASQIYKKYLSTTTFDFFLFGDQKLFLLIKTEIIKLIFYAKRCVKHLGPILASLEFFSTGKGPL